MARSRYADPLWNDGPADDKKNQPSGVWRACGEGLGAQAFFGLRPLAAMPRFALARAGKRDQAIAAFQKLRGSYRGSWIDRVSTERLKTLRQPPALEKSEPK